MPNMPGSPSAFFRDRASENKDCSSLPTVTPKNARLPSAFRRLTVPLEFIVPGATVGHTFDLLRRHA
jgi:hypothetical protein